MAHEVPWDRRIVEEFIDQAMLSDDEQWLLRTRIQGMPRCQQADALGLSERSLDRMIRRLKKQIRSGTSQLVHSAPAQGRGMEYPTIMAVLRQLFGS